MFKSLGATRQMSGGATRADGSQGSHCYLINLGMERKLISIDHVLSGKNKNTNTNKGIMTRQIRCYLRRFCVRGGLLTGFNDRVHTPGQPRVLRVTPPNQTYVLILNPP